MTYARGYSTKFSTRILIYPMKCLPFYLHEVWKRYLFWVEPPRVGHYREYPHGVFVQTILESCFVERPWYAFSLAYKKGREGGGHSV